MGKYDDDLHTDDLLLRVALRRGKSVRDPRHGQRVSSVVTDWFRNRGR